MTSHPAFRNFAFAYASHSRSFMWSRRAKGLALFTFYPTLGIVLWAASFPRCRRSRVGFLAPEMYWYGWTATAASGR